MKFGRYVFLLVILFMGAMSNHAHGQSNCSYVVVSLGGYSQNQVDQAFGQAHLDSYRKVSVRRTLKFVNGAEIQLYSASELQGMGCAVDVLQAMEDNTELDPTRIFEIHPSGIIIEHVGRDLYKEN